MSIVRRCELIELSHSTFYYLPAGENADNLAFMRLIDEQFTKRPFYGVPRMTASLRAMKAGLALPRLKRRTATRASTAILPIRAWLR